MDNVLTKLVSGRLSTYAAIILMFTYSLLLDRDFECTCKQQDLDCYVYLFLPVVIIFLLILSTDRPFQAVCKFVCSCPFGCCGSCECCSCSHREATGFRFCCQPYMIRLCCSSICKLLKAALFGLLWVAFVLVDGDWYVCCKSNQSEQEKQVACKNKRNLTDNDQVIIAELINESRVIGGFSLFGILLLTFITPLFGRSTCCRKSSHCNRKVLYAKMLLEEEGKVLKEMLRESAKEDLTNKFKDKIHRKQWEECFDVVEDLIKSAEEPQTTETQGEDQEPTERQPLLSNEEPGPSSDP
ncbi:uncharacterized protein LOC119906090 [Micropterus salmoides]|uniref:uncharacterized protein LOC119906090 n=1 Tax=Micropterus salmoides TaxID=27706 RepID=UPI0018EB59FC|nr:uncharacterized protein LOC119906090 [Micropterus salmoides]